MRITILVPGFGLSSAVTAPFEVFDSTGVVWNALHGEASDRRFDIETASADGAPVRFPGGITITPDRSYAQVRQTDLLYVPTIGLDTAAVLAGNPGILRLLRRQAKRGAIVAGVCTGVSLLAEAGLLDGRPATTHWAIAEQMRERYPRVDWKPELFITESDNIFCGGGVFAALDLCLHLVERLTGYETARQCGRAMLIDSPRTWQSSFSAPALNQQHHDDRIRQAQDYLHEHFQQPLTVDSLARETGMSSRNFSRRFKQATGQPPLTYLHQLRIDCAKRLLETDFKSVQEVCFDVGYEDVPHFRKLFKRHTGLTPGAYRERFGGRTATGEVMAPLV